MTELTPAPDCVVVKDIKIIPRENTELMLPPQERLGSFEHACVGRVERVGTRVSDVHHGDAVLFMDLSGEFINETTKVMRSECIMGVIIGI